MGGGLRCIAPPAPVPTYDRPAALRDFTRPGAAAAAAAATLAVTPMISRRDVLRHKAGKAVCALSSATEKLSVLKKQAAELGGFDKVMLACGG